MRIDDADLTALIRRAVPGRDVRPQELVELGWDNLVLFATLDGVPWVFRLPRRPDVVVDVRREAAILALLRGRLPIAIPDWTTHEWVDGQLVIGYRRVPGEPAGADGPGGEGFALALPDPPPGVFVAGLGAALAALHIVPVAAVATAIGEPRSDRDRIAARLARLRADLPLDPVLLDFWDASLADDRLWQQIRLVHHDVHPGHTLIDDTGRLVGLIDWTDAGWGDPAADFADTRDAFGPAFTDRLRDAYHRAGGPEEESLAARIVFRHALAATVAAEFGLQEGRTDIVGLAQRRLARQARRLALGLPPI